MNNVHQKLKNILVKKDSLLSVKGLYYQDCKNKYNLRVDDVPLELSSYFTFNNKRTKKT